jgi:hypothetical protein
MKKLVLLTVMMTYACGGAVSSVDPNWQPPNAPIPNTSAFAKEKEEYRVMYYWLAQYDQQDVTIPKETVDYDAKEFASNEDVFRMWSMFSNRGRALADVKILQLDPKHFLLNNIDKDGKLHTKQINGSTAYDFVDEVSAAWWYGNFDYSKNPHYHRASVINRALIYSIADLIMLDSEHEKGNFNRTDFIGGNLIKFAIPYYEGKDQLPKIVQKSYETLLLKMFERAETWKITGIFGDMESQAAVGMYYTAKALDDHKLLIRAATRAEEVYTKMINGAGFENHENGADMVYQGIYMFFASWLLSATQADPDAADLYSFVIPYIDRACKFINYMTVVEPNSSSGQIRITGPSHFNVANNGSPRNMIWNSGIRSFLAGSGYSDQCKTRVFNQHEISYAAFPLTTSIAKMKTDLISFMKPSNFINNGNDSTNYQWAINYSNPETPSAGWAETHWGQDTSTIYTYTFYKPKLYATLMADKASNAKWTKYPYNFSNNFIEVLEDTHQSAANKKPWFIIGKSSSMHTIWHVGGLGWRNDESSTIAGFGGGAISSVSTIGPVIMGRERGNQTQPHTLSEWKIWATHHMAGADENGKYFGTARDRDLNRTVTKNGNQSVNVVVTGTIGPTNNKTAPNGSITGSVNYSREFDFDQQDGIAVESILNTNGLDQAKELYEIIPVYLYDDALNDIVANPTEKTVISFYKSGGWVTPTTSNTTNVTDIRLNRYGAPLYIHFATAQSVKLAATEMVQTTGHDRSHSRNILIDLLKNNGATVTLPLQVKINYTIDTTPP